ncbi:MAG: M23 family metallopeptidase [Bradymonadia bacterium]
MKRAEVVGLLPCWALLLFWVGSAGAKAPSLPMVYPLDHPPAVTSTFGTYRIGHHHAGLDLVTGGDESVAVLAAADGEVYRIRRSHSGYGRSVYVRHPGGWTTVYGHLSAYVPQLATLVKAREQKVGDYPLAFNLEEPIPVKAGEALGLVGTSGTDLVHLHFELRKGGVPVNPLRRGLKIPDTQAPRIARLLAMPREASAHVAHDQADRIFMVRKGRISAPVVIGGDVGLMVEVNDRIDGSTRDLSPWSVELKVDGKRRHLTRYDRVSYGKKDKAHVELDFEPGRRARREGLFNKLFREGPHVRVHRKGPPPDLVDLAPGDHEALIIARDAAGNTSKLKFTLRVVPAKPPCPWSLSKAAPGEGTLVDAPERLWRGRRVVVPLPGACGGAEQQLKVRWRGAPLEGATLSRLEDEPALAVTLPEGEGGDLDIGYLRDGKPVRHRIEVLPVSPEGTFESGPVRFAVGSKALFLPYATERVEGPQPVVNGLEAVTPIQRLTNRWWPTRSGSAIGIRLPSTADPSGVGVYLGEGDRWWYLGGAQEAGWITGYTVHLGPFALMRDVARPTIEKPSVQPHPGGPRLVVPVTDKGSGVSSVSITVDDRPVHAEWMSGYQQAVWRSWSRMKPGDHKVTVEARDRVGHTRRWSGQVRWP